MADIESRTIHILRELRTAIKAMDEKMDSGFTDIRSRMDSLRVVLSSAPRSPRTAAVPR